jgi:hypothetical protein
MGMGHGTLIVEWFLNILISLLGIFDFTLR